jgi:phage baseplate assembly protein W
MAYSDYNNNGASNISVKKDRVFADLDLSFKPHPAYNDIRPITDIDAVKQSVKNLLLTQRGERLFNPNIGSGIFEQLFDNVDVYTFESIRNKIKDMISSLEPRVGKIKVNIKDEAELNSMAVTVQFNVIGTPGDQTIDFYLERLR